MWEGRAYQTAWKVTMPPRILFGHISMMYTWHVILLDQQRGRGKISRHGGNILKDANPCTIAKLCKGLHEKLSSRARLDKGERGNLPKQTGF